MEEFSIVCEIPPDEADDEVDSEAFSLIAALLASLPDGAVEAEEDATRVQWDEEFQSLGQVMGHAGQLDLGHLVQKVVRFAVEAFVDRQGGVPGAV